MNKATYATQLTALIAEISTVFQGVTREHGVSLSESWVIDDYGSDEERAVARASDEDTQWQDVPAEDIRCGYSCLSFLDNIGFCYYIPAYMIWTLSNQYSPDSDTPEYTIYALTINDPQNYEQLHELNRRLGRHELPSYEWMRDWSLARFAIFTHEQSKAIAHYLQFLAEHYEDKEAQKAIDNYWHKFV